MKLQLAVVVGPCWVELVEGLGAPWQQVVHASANNKSLKKQPPQDIITSPREGSS